LIDSPLIDTLIDCLRGLASDRSETSFVGGQRPTPD